MCGITGIVSFKNEKVSLSTLKKMTDSINHRGPDGEGYWIKDNLGLGHKRLSIIDLSSNASQPMASSDERYIISYNGEIYNFSEIRDELINLGYEFRSQSDTEVVLCSLIEWGEAGISKFNGMFAFAFYDNAKKELLIARDRYGIKPLYYSNTEKYFIFGSEQKSILNHPEFKSKIDKEALLEYFTFQNIFTDKTLQENIKILPPGSFLTIKTDKDFESKVNKKQYWDFLFKEPEGKFDRKDYVDELQRLFDQAVKRQLVSDVELGSYLSGGMDSGSITAIAAQKINDLKTFTCGFDLSSASGIELAFDERQKAEAMSARFKTEHYEIVLKAGDMERSLNNLSWHLEEPRVGQSYPNFYAAKLASKFVKVVLSGAGGDELFGGYPWRYYRAANSKNFDEYVDEYYLYWQRLINNKELKNLFLPISKETSSVWTKDIFKDVFQNHDNELSKPEDFINHSLYFEAKTFLHGLLVVEDKLSMAHSLETRVPFLDNDLVDFAMSCPVNLKINNLADVLDINENDPLKKQKFFTKTNDGKQILRDTMKTYIPKEIYESEKQGFSSPDASWFKGESIEFVKSRLSDENSPIYEFLDFKTAHDLINQHLSGKNNRRLFIWSLLNVNEYIAGNLS